MKWFACERAAMEISREEKEEEEDKEIRRQDEVIVGERIELHSLGLSELSLTWFTGERQVRHRVTSWPVSRQKGLVQEFNYAVFLSRDTFNTGYCNLSITSIDLNTIELPKSAKPLFWSALFGTTQEERPQAATFPVSCLSPSIIIWLLSHKVCEDVQAAAFQHLGPTDDSDRANMAAGGCKYWVYSGLGAERRPCSAGPIKGNLWEEEVSPRVCVCVQPSVTWAFGSVLSDSAPSDKYITGEDDYDHGLVSAWRRSRLWKHCLLTWYLRSRKSSYIYILYLYILTFKSLWCENHHRRHPTGE